MPRRSPVAAPSHAPEAARPQAEPFEAKLPLARFGQRLREARKDTASRMSQAEAAEAVNGWIRTREASRRGRGKVSQSLIASYEIGSVLDPHPTILRALAELYGADYQEWVTELAREKYAPEGGWSPDAAEARWELLAASWQQPALDGPGLLADQLRAKAEMVRGGVLLSLSGLTEWERAQPAGTSFWILAPDLVAADSSAIHDTVVTNLLKSPPARYVYFIDPACVDRFRRYISLLKRDRRLAKKAGLVNRQLECIKLPAKALEWISTDLIVAHPDVAGRTEVFRYILSGHTPLAHRLAPQECADLLKGWKNWEAGAARIALE